MKKIIILVIIAVIPILIAINGNSKITLKDRVEKDGYVINPKDSLWEFVKNEIEQGRIDLDINYQRTYKEPILISLQGASKKDSLLVEKIMDELKIIFPKKQIHYYNDFTKEKYIPYDIKNEWKKSFTKQRDEFYSYTTVLDFNKEFSYFDNEFELEMDVGGSVNFHRKFNLNKEHGLNFGYRKNKWNKFIQENYLGLNIPKEREESKCVSFLKNAFLKMYLEQNYNNSLENIKPNDRLVNAEFKIYNADFIEKNNSSFKENYTFFFEKLFANDFKEQFTAYMYKTYPWQYASVFIDKDKARKNANALIVVLGILLLIFSTSIFWNKKTALTFYDYFFAVFVFSVGFGSLNNLYSFVFHIDLLNLSIFENLILLLDNTLRCLLVSFIFWQIEKQINQKINQFGYGLLLKLVATFCILYLPYLLVLENKDLLIDNGFIVSQSVTDLQFLFLLVGLTITRGLIIYLNHYAASQLRQKNLEISNLKALKAKAELKFLQSHINPHFLYNALNSIAGLVHTSPDKSEKMVLSLSNLFRYSINKKGKQMNTVAEEVVMVQNYLAIESERFGDRLQVTINVDDEIKNEEIPMFILQPLVENAIKHGVSKIRMRGKIVLKIEKERNTIVISVSDNGPDFPDGLVSGYGLQMVYDLLRLCYGDKASLTWENAPVKQIVIAIDKN